MTSKDGLMSEWKRRLSLLVVRMKTKDARADDEDESDFSDEEDEDSEPIDKDMPRIEIFKQTFNHGSIPNLSALNKPMVGLDDRLPFGKAGLRGGAGGAQSDRKLSIREFLMAKSNSAGNGFAQKTGLPGQLMVPEDRPVTPIHYQRRSSICLTK